MQGKTFICYSGAMIKQIQTGHAEKDLKQPTVDKEVELLINKLTIRMGGILLLSFGIMAVLILCWR